MDKLDRKDQEIVWQKFKELIKGGADVDVREDGHLFQVYLSRPGMDDVSWHSDKLFDAIDGILESVDGSKDTTKTNQYWQLCPKCMGEIMPIAPCDICHDEKIISTLNGQPPSKQ